MQQAQLAALVEQPEIHRMILGDYKGAYSLGLTLNPQNHSELAIRVRIEGEDAGRIPDHITVEGTMIPVVVQPSFKAPVPYSSAQQTIC